MESSIQLNNQSTRQTAGGIARINGDKFEKLCIESLKQAYSLEKNAILKVGDTKIRSIIQTTKKTAKKTQSKTDIIIKAQQQQVNISVKMSNKGTQLQIIPLDNFFKYFSVNGVEISDIVKIAFQKTCGVQKPSKEQLTQFNQNRNAKQKNNDKFYSNELDETERDQLTQFIQQNYSLILELIFIRGLGSDETEYANFFLFNDADYTKTQDYQPILVSWQTVRQKLMSIEKVQTTAQKGFQLCEYITFQRKGSGKSQTSKNCLQFKDNGISHLFSVINELEAFMSQSLNQRTDEELLSAMSRMTI